LNSKKVCTIKHIGTPPIDLEPLINLCRVIEVRDGLSNGHIDRVGELSFQIAVKMGFEKEICGMLRHTAKIHDLGKVAIPDSILGKPAKLTKKSLR